MFAFIFTIITFFFGWALCSLLLPEELQKNLVKLPLSIMIGTLIGVWIVFLFNLFFPLFTAFIIVLYLLLLGSIFIFPFKKPHHFIPKISIFDICVLVVCIGISIFLIHQSLHFTPTGILDIASNCWGDFDLHLPLIRSFAWGSNMPPSLPSFPNANAAYHFMFDYWSAILTFGGLPLSYAFNIASIISFSSLLYLAYTFFIFLFDKKRLIGIFGIVLFLFNSTLTFVEAYPKLHPKNIVDFFYKNIQNTQYLSAGPFTSDHVSIIWNLNVYLNQRHFIFSLAVGAAVLLIFLTLLRHILHTKHIIFLGILIGLLPFCNIHVFLCTIIVFSILLLFFFRRNKKILFIIPIACAIALPQILWLSHDIHSMVQWNPGFLAPHPLTLTGVLIYWFYNLGLSLFTIPLGFFLANREQKKWFLAFLAIFLVGNLFQFNSDMFNNHKLFNFWILFSNGYSALVLFSILQRKHIWKWPLIIVLLFFLTFSGVIDMFVIKNEHFYTINDYGNDPFINWVATNTEKMLFFLFLRIVCTTQLEWQDGKHTLFPHDMLTLFDMMLQSEIQSFKICIMHMIPIRLYLF